MKRCKYINEYLVRWFRNPVREDGRLYSNPTAAQLEALGYLPFVDSPKGEEVAGTVQVARYRLKDTSVYRIWIYVEDKGRI